MERMEVRRESLTGGGGVDEAKHKIAESIVVCM